MTATIILLALIVMAVLLVRIVAHGRKYKDEQDRIFDNEFTNRYRSPKP